jgi:hypothetical protein
MEIPPNLRLQFHELSETNFKGICRTYGRKLPFGFRGHSSSPMVYTVFLGGSCCADPHVAKCYNELALAFKAFRKANG